MLTPEQLAKIRAKEAATPDALKRDPLTDYFEGYFFVTLNTRNVAPILSTVCGRVGATGADAPHCEYTALGEKVREVIDSIHVFHPLVTVLASEVMPEHLHILLYMQPGGREHLGRVVGGFMTGCSHAYWDTLGIDWRNNHPTQGQQVRLNESKDAAASRRAGWQDRDHTRSFRGPALFVRGYNDVVPITTEEVAIKVEYIRRQAEKRLIQGDRHECFRITRHAHSRNWSLEVALRAVAADRVVAHNPARLAAAMANIRHRLNDGLDYMGYPPLMASTRKLPLVCHRSDAHRFDEQRRAVIEAARRGCVIVSAFISPRERDIMKQLMVEQLPFIEIMDNGFSDRYKPTGKAFYACGENRLVQITPWCYEYQRDTAICREMCMVMNALACIISGRPDDWWK